MVEVLLGVALDQGLFGKRLEMDRELPREGRRLVEVGNKSLCFGLNKNSTRSGKITEQRRGEERPSPTAYHTGSEALQERVQLASLPPSYGTRHAKLPYLANALLGKWRTARTDNYEVIPVCCLLTLCGAYQKWTLSTCFSRKCIGVPQALEYVVAHTKNCRTDKTTANLVSF